MQNYTTPNIDILILTVEWCLAASLEQPEEGEVIPW